ncbi:DUF4743 domain-containing protein [Rhabdochromatium marinum]|uniref:DUF4743 domain-containing protein n=1 Tax=Rhabdochromatium marinum TaxID=48729 RepID=UPI0019032AEC|nr:DUF4743 domain-containing protein [Rhabdochromatium marinum]MBK1650250.1 DUF4743 domain-containing protein [Rhabdochromatium marinum]
MSFIDHIEACNRWNPEDFLPWQLGDETLGWMRPAFAEALCAVSRLVAQVSQTSQTPQAGDTGVFELTGPGLRWQAEGLSFAARSARLADICVQLQHQELLPAPQGERYPVTPARRDQARCVIDRAYAPYFGTRAFGQHLNGYVEGAEGLELWVARRAADRRHYPNRFDNTVAGGLPHDLDLSSNLRKECFEEAGLPAAIADRARPVSAISYCRATRAGLKPDLMYCYDLQLPPERIPRGTDGEVAAFERWPVARVLETVRDTDEFKLNCNLVIIDFLIRHGLITPDDPDYFELICRLRSPLPTPITNH